MSEKIKRNKCLKICKRILKVIKLFTYILFFIYLITILLFIIIDTKLNFLYSKQYNGNGKGLVQKIEEKIEKTKFEKYTYLGSKKFGQVEKGCDGKNIMQFKKKSTNEIVDITFLYHAKVNTTSVYDLYKIECSDRLLFRDCVAISTSNNLLENEELFKIVLDTLYHPCEIKKSRDKNYSEYYDICKNTKNYKGILGIIDEDGNYIKIITSKNKNISNNKK